MRPRERSRGLIGVPGRSPRNDQGGAVMERDAQGARAQSIASVPGRPTVRPDYEAEHLGVPVSELRITLDGGERAVASGTTAAEVLGGAVAARVNGELRDLAYRL